MAGPRYHRQSELIQQINALLKSEGLTFCTLQDEHGTRELGSHFILRAGTLEVVQTGCCPLLVGLKLGLVELGDTVGA